MAALSRSPRLRSAAFARLFSRLEASRRALCAPEAVIDRILSCYPSPSLLNLAPGVAHWTVPPSVRAAAIEGGRRGYGACQGDDDLLAALHAKLESFNRIDMAGREVMVTSGANQAFVQALLCLCDWGDEAVLFSPYYVSHLAALQICGLHPIVIPVGPDGLPDVDVLKAELTRRQGRVKAVVLCSPSNPSGAVCPEPLGRAIQLACAHHRAWLLTDEAYEDFTFDGHSHASLAGQPGSARVELIGDQAEASLPTTLTDGVVSLFTFSKSYGLPSWRVGYMVYPRRLHDAMLKLQDTMPTHASRQSQAVALRALTQLGSPWVREQVSSLQEVRALLWHPLSRLYDDVKRTRGVNLQKKHPPGGAIYFLLPLPPGVDEEVAIRWSMACYSYQARHSELRVHCDSAMDVSLQMQRQKSLTG
ncbi:MAG: hypothetical protein SGPRY_013070 [Prymnesium sp.]